MWPHLLKTFFIGNFIFCAVRTFTYIEGYFKYISTESIDVKSYDITLSLLYILLYIIQDYGLKN